VAALPELRAQTGCAVGAYANAFRDIPDDFDEEADAMDATEALGRREDLDPETYAEYGERWIRQGALIVGGCCEVGPDHIAHLRTVVDDVRASR
jgi:homocysteine S-methyltransferase